MFLKKKIKTFSSSLYRRFIPTLLTWKTKPGPLHLPSTIPYRPFISHMGPFALCPYNECALGSVKFQSIEPSLHLEKFQYFPGGCGG